MRANLTLVLFAVLAAACGETMKTPTDPGVYSTKANANGQSSAPLDMSPGTTSPAVAPYQMGNASWYGDKLAGRKTANGERFDPMAFTAAHKTLKFGTWVEVRRPDTGQSVRVKINDRGPHVAGRIIDLSRRAAQELDLVREGVTRVEIRVVDGP